MATHLEVSAAPHEEAIQRHSVSDPIAYLGGSAGFKEGVIKKRLGHWDIVWMRDTNGTLTQTTGLDVIASQLTSAMLADKLGQRQKGFSPRAIFRRFHTPSSTTDLVNQIVAPEQERNPYGNDLHLHEYLRQLSEEKGISFEKAKEQFTDQQLLKLVRQREADGQEVQLRLERTPEELDAYLTNKQTVLVSRGHNVTVVGSAGIKFDNTRYDLIQDAVANLSITFSGIMDPSVVGGIMNEQEGWKRNLAILSRVLQEQARILFDQNKECFLREGEGDQPLAPQQNLDIQSACEVRTEGLVKRSLNASSFHLDTRKHYRPIKQYDPSIMYSY